MSNTSIYRIKLKSMLARSEKHLTKIEFYLSHSISYLSKVLLICIYFYSKIFSQDPQSNRPFFLGSKCSQHTTKTLFLSKLSFIPSLKILLSICYGPEATLASQNIKIYFGERGEQDYYLRKFPMSNWN